MKKLLIGLLALGSLSIYAQDISPEAKSETEAAQIKCRNEIYNLVRNVSYYGDSMKDEILETYMNLVELECNGYGQIVEKNSYNPTVNKL